MEFLIQLIIILTFEFAWEAVRTLFTKNTQTWNLLTELLLKEKCLLNISFHLFKQFLSNFHSENCIVTRSYIRRLSISSPSPQGWRNWYYSFCKTGFISYIFLTLCKNWTQLFMYKGSPLRYRTKSTWPLQIRQYSAAPFSQIQLVSGIFLFTCKYYYYWLLYEVKTSLRQETIVYLHLYSARRCYKCNEALSWLSNPVECIEGHCFD